jgi:DNA-binding HxlR family transcriptional regulator
VESAAKQPRDEGATPSAGRARGPVCPDFHEAIELVGRRWAGAILWALSDGAHYFADFAESVPGVSDRLLSRRLRELEAEGLVERSVHEGTPARVSYALTEKGRALVPALSELKSWARAWRSSS